MNEPDEKSVITYVSSLYDVFPDVPSVEETLRDNVSIMGLILRDNVSILGLTLRDNVSILGLTLGDKGAVNGKHFFPKFWPKVQKYRFSRLIA